MSDDIFTRIFVEIEAVILAAVGDDGRWVQVGGKRKDSVPCGNACTAESETFGFYGFMESTSFRYRGLRQSGRSA